VFDAGIYTGFLLLAAEALGIGAVPQAAVAYHADLLRKHLGIAPRHRIICAVSFGEKDATHPANRFRTTRTGLNQAAVWIGG
jgi:nitroreductase